MLRLTVSRPVCLGVKPNLGPETSFVTVRQLQVSWCRALSLTRGRVCRLQLLLALASAVIHRSVSRGAHDHVFLSQIRDFPNLEDQVRIYPPGTEWPSYTPRHWVPFSSPSTTRRATVEVFEPSSTRALIYYFNKLQQNTVGAVFLLCQLWSFLMNWQRSEFAPVLCQFLGRSCHN
jgi:hypothetical protein